MAFRSYSCVEFGAVVDHVGVFGNEVDVELATTALSVAAYRGDTKIILYLLGVDVNLPAEDPGQRLIGAAVYGGQTAAVKLLLHRVDLAPLQQGRRDMVSGAVMYGTPELLPLLLDALVDQNIDALSKPGLTCEAAGCRDLGIVKLLLARGVRMEKKAGSSVSLLDKRSKKDDAQVGMLDIEGERFGSGSKKDD